MVEFEGGDVIFILFHVGVLSFGGASDEDDEEAGGERVESAGMADLEAGFFLGVESIPDLGDGLKRGNIGRFIIEDDAVFFVAGVK